MLYPVSGCKFYIGGAVDEKNVPWVEADFAAQTWVEVKKWTQMGPIGPAAQLITSDIIGEEYTKKAKGTRNTGSMQNVFDVDNLDAGQIALIAAEATRNNYAIRVVLNDAPVAGTLPTPSERLFVGLVMSAQEQGGGANTVQGLNVLIEINSNIVRVAADTGD